MAKREKKKYNNMKLEQNELTPTAIGAFENRKRSSIGTFLILAIFVLAIVFMPQISEYINNYLHPKVDTPSTPPSTPVKPTIPVDDDDDSDDDNFTAYVDNLKITNNEVTVSNMIVDTTTNVIRYDVTNNLNDAQNLEDLNYYLEIFNQEQTLTERVKLADNAVLGSGAFKSYSKSIESATASTIGFVSLVKKSISDYPIVELNTFNEGIGSLVCSRENEKVTYKFREDKLKELVSEVSYLNTDVNYETIYSDYKLKSSTYSNNIGVVSTFFDSGAGFNITTSVNLSEADRMYVFNADSFRLDTEPKVVKFEMEAQGFKCE